MHIHIHHDCDGPNKQLLKELLDVVTQNQTILKELKVTDDQVSTLLDQVNTTTNAIALNQTQDATTLGQVKSELDTLIAAGQAGGISDATAAKLTTLSNAITQMQTNATANSATLKAIAAEGAPVVPAPPAPPPVPAV